MAYIVRRPRRCFEVRESTLTRKGPRSRTLAAFTLLSGDVIAHARSRSADPPDADALRRLAVRAGTPVAAARPDGAALALIAELASGRSVAPGLRRALLARLQGASDDDSLRWATATDEQRGQALHDLLELADRIPRRRRGVLSFPPLARRSAHG